MKTFKVAFHLKQNKNQTNTYTREVPGKITDETSKTWI